MKGAKAVFPHNDNYHVGYVITLIIESWLILIIPNKRHHFKELTLPNIIFAKTDFFISLLLTVDM